MARRRGRSYPGAVKRLAAGALLLLGLAGLCVAGPMVECRDASGRARITDKGCGSGETEVANYSKRKRSPPPEDPSVGQLAAAGEEAPLRLAEYATPEKGLQFVKGLGGALAILVALGLVALVGPRRSSA